MTLVDFIGGFIIGAAITFVATLLFGIAGGGIALVISILAVVFFGGAVLETERYG